MIRNHIKREYEEVVNKIKANYKEELSLMKKECLSLFEIIESRDIYIHKLCMNIADNEIHLNKAIHIMSKYKDKKEKKKSDLDENFYLEQIYNLSCQNNNLKETCLLYQKDIDSLKLKLKTQKDHQLTSENNLKSEIKKLQSTLKQKEIDYDNKLKYFNRQ